MLFVLCHLGASLCLVSVSYLYHHSPLPSVIAGFSGSGTLMIMMIAQCLQLPVSDTLSVSFPFPSHETFVVFVELFCLLSDTFGVIYILFSHSSVIYITSAVICDCVCQFSRLQSHSSAYNAKNFQD